MWLIIHRPCEYIPLPPLTHANSSHRAGIYEVVDKRRATHRVFDLSFMSSLFGCTRIPSSQAGATLRVEQFDLKGVATGESKLVGWGRGVRTVGRGSRSVRVCIDRLLATRDSSWRPGASTK